MQQYNPREASRKDNPEQQIIKAARTVEYDRQFKKSAEDKLNQENPTPQGVFRVQTQAVARNIVERASNLVNEKNKGDISNGEFAADMAMVNQMVDNLGNFSKTVEKNLAAYNKALKDGTLSYGMDQHNEAVLQAIDKGDVKLALDEDGRVKMEGKANHSGKGKFDVNIYDFTNIPLPVIKIKPINTLVDPYVQNLGLDENGIPITRLDEQGQLIYDSGDYGEHEKEVLGFTRDALESVGPEGIRSYLGDHLNMPQDEIKALAEDVNYTDENGRSWQNAAEAKAYDSLNEYIGGKYQRQSKPHPNTIALNAQNQASDIAANKNVELSQGAIVEDQQTEAMETPQGEVSETTTETEDVSMPNLAENMFDASTEETVEEDVEETQNSPLTMKALSAADLIKKYS
jgi:hypothetical protein